MLQRLLSPRSIAFIGGHWARTAIKQSINADYRGTIYYVNQRGERMDEFPTLPVYSHVRELPAAPDAAFIAVNRQQTIDTIAHLSAIGSGGAICFAAGFSESGDHARTQQLCAAAGTMPFLGPNCYGLLNYLDGALLWPDQHGGKRILRGVAIISQSGNISISITMQQRGLPLAVVCAIGNQTRVGFAELSQALLADPRITAIGWLMEAVDNSAELEDLLRAAHGKKPIVVLKLGASQQGASATLSHTASLSGNDTAANAFFQRHGVARTHTLTEFLETLKLLHVHGVLSGRRVLSMSCSGGEAALAADTIESYPLSLKQFSSPTQAQIKKEMGELVVAQNPYDYHTFVWGDPAKMQQTYQTAMADGFDLSLLLLDFPRRDRCHDDDWQLALSALIAARQALPPTQATAVVATLPENMPEAMSAQAHDNGITAFATLTDALNAAQHAAFIGEHWRCPLPLPLLAAARPTTAATCLVDEYEAKQRLTTAGVEVANGVCASRARINSDDAVAATLSYPLAVKALGLAHKSEQHAVHLACADIAAVRAAVAQMAEVENLGDAFLLEEMVQDKVAELLIGIRQDALAGLTLTLASGGTQSEVLNDSVCLLLPTTSAAVTYALSTLRAYPLWCGYRGAAAADMTTAINQIMAIAAYAEQQAPQIVELEINPLIVGVQQAVVADVLMLCRAE